MRLRWGDLPPTGMAMGTWGVQSRPLQIHVCGRYTVHQRWLHETPEWGGDCGGPWPEVVKPQSGASRRKPPTDVCPAFGISRRIHTWEERHSQWRELLPGQCLEVQAKK